MAVLHTDTAMMGRDEKNDDVHVDVYETVVVVVIPTEGGREEVSLYAYDDAAMEQGVVFVDLSMPQPRRGMRRCASGCECE